MVRAAIVTTVTCVLLGAAAFVRSRDPDSGSRERAQLARTTETIEFFRARLDADPIDAGAAAALASRYVRRFQLNAQLADLADAERVLVRTLPYAGDAAEAHAAISAVRLMRHDFTGAWQAALAARAVYGGGAAANAAWFDAALATGRLAQADSALAALDAKSLAARVRRAHWLDVQGEGGAAVEALSGVCEQLDRSAARPEPRAWCHTELAGLVGAVSGAQAARRALRDALRIQPGYRGALEGLADLSHASGDWRAAIRTYERIAVDAHPDLYLRLAEAHRALGRVDEAETWERAFLRVTDADTLEALFAHPLALFLAERIETRDRALAIAQRDVERRPAAESFDVLAWVHFRRGEREAARSASDRAVAAGVASPTLMYRRARILAADGDGAAGVLLRTAVLERNLLEHEARLDLDRLVQRSR